MRTHTNKTARIISTILTISIIFLLASCGLSAQSHEREQVRVREQRPGSGVTVTDASGTVLEVPSDAGSIKIASVYAAAVPFIAALGLADRTVAVNPKSVFWEENVPAFKGLPMVGRGSVDPEKLAAVSPDVLIHRTGDPKTAEAAQRLGIPTLCISAEDLDGVLATIDLLGAYCGATARAEEAKAYVNTKFDMIEEIVRGIPESDRVTAIVIGSETGRVAGGDMLQDAMLKLAGAKGIMDDVKNNRTWSDIGTEEVFSKNPDFLFCTGSTRLNYEPGSLKSDKAWSAMNAVKNDHIYVIPTKIDSWDLPGISCVLGTLFMLRSMYPDYYSEEELSAEIDEYYQFIFGKTFERDYLGY